MTKATAALPLPPSSGDGYTAHRSETHSWPAGVTHAITSADRMQGLCVGTAQPGRSRVIPVGLEAGPQMSCAGPHSGRSRLLASGVCGSPEGLVNP